MPQVTTITYKLVLFFEFDCLQMSCKKQDEHAWKFGNMIWAYFCTHAIWQNAHSGQDNSLDYWCMILEFLSANRVLASRVSVQELVEPSNVLGYVQDLERKLQQVTNAEFGFRSIVTRLSSVVCGHPLQLDWHPFDNSIAAWNLRIKNCLTW